MSGMTRLSFSKRLVDALAMFLVAIGSLVLLVYVAFGEAKRTYEQFQVEKLVAQGQVVQSVLESFVRPGLPIMQFGGFNQLAEPMVRSDPMIDAISFHDVGGARVFVAGQDDLVLLDSEHVTRRVGEFGIELRSAGELLQVVLPVRSRFELVGHVVLSVPRSKIAERVEQAFLPLVQIGFGACLVFALFVLLFSHRFAQAARDRWVAGAFVATFLLVATFVISTLINVYAQGAQARAKSLADSLGQRLDDVVAFNLNFDDITGITTLFGEYKRLNPDIRSAALIVDGKVRAHVDPARRGQEWDHVANDYEYAVLISSVTSPREVVIKVALPREVVMRQVARSVKNFLALFVASAFFAAIFMGLARSLQRLSDFHEEKAWTEAEEKAVINLVKPAFFMAVFVEHLSYAFLPTAMQAAARAAGLTEGYAAAPFMAYYLAFALSLIPAGRLERQIGAKVLMLAGLVMAGGGLAAMAYVPEFWMAVGARALSGVGQGVLFIGVQAYVLANSAPQRRTQAGGAIVFGFQAGMIAGMAIGSLLVSYLGPQGIFTLGSLLALLIAVYVATALPRQLAGNIVELAPAASALKDFVKLLRDDVFARTVFLVGMPAKAVLTGVILFALPLLLTQQGFVKEDVGQIIMVYAGAVILASHFAALRVDKTSGSEKVLFQGVVMTALGLGIIASTGWLNWSANSAAGTLLILAGVTLVGFAHGCINAPIVTHVTNAEVSGAMGATNVAAGYRLLERVGHVLGPIVMGQLFLAFGTGWLVLGGVAVGVFLLGALFLTPHQAADESAEISK